VHCRAFAAMTRKGSFTVTYHTLTVTVVRISNLYQACYRCILPGKTAQAFHRQVANSCSPKLESNAGLLRLLYIMPVSANPRYRAAAAMRSYQLSSQTAGMGCGRLDSGPSEFLQEMSHASCTADPP
jgi:hypothetical protein